MVASAYLNSPRRGLLLEVTFETEIGVAFSEQARIHGAVNFMAGGASLPHGLMLEDKGTFLSGVALRASVMFHRQSRAAGNDGGSFVGIMTIAAADLSFQHRMVRRKIELASFIEMALKTSFGRFARIDDRVVRAAAFGVQAAWAMARFAAHLRRIGPGGLEPCVGGAGKALGNILVTLRARLRSNVGRSGNLRRHHNGAVDRHAGDQRGEQRKTTESGEQGGMPNRSARTAGLEWFRLCFTFHRFESVGV